MKPIDEDEILKYISKSSIVVTIEDGTIIGGLGSELEKIININNIDTKLIKIAYPDEFIKHGSICEIESKYGLDAISISNNILNSIKIRNIKNLKIGE